MKEIKSRLLQTLGNGKAKIIQHNREQNFEDYFFNVFKSKIEEAIGPFILFKIDPNFFDKNIASGFEKIINMAQGNRVVLFIDDLFDFKDPDAIICTLYGKKNLDAFIFTNVDLPYKLKKKETNVRGRYDYFYLPPAMSQIKKSIGYHLKPIDKFYGANKEEVISIYKYLVNHAGEVLSYRDIWKGTGKANSLTSCVHATEFLFHYSMVFKLKRTNIETNKELDNGFVFYPTFSDDIDLTEFSSLEKQDIKQAILLISRMIVDGNDVSLAISTHGKDKNGKYLTRVLFKKGYLITNYDKKVVLRISDSDDEELPIFKKTKTNIQHIVALPGHMEYRLDNDGIVYAGIEKIIEEGIKGYGGF